MSIYADLVCTQCDVRLWLGKVIHHGDANPIYFHAGPADEAPNWARDELNAVLWKLLAEHARHPLRVVVEGDADGPPTDASVELGGDRGVDISFGDYLAGWPGLR
ncbi:hypothetical protein [Nocardia sp. NPDC052316]|uniref:hypothetical protein n=1 Tax=Nocardia sp. NPDC052316 TaxID=3364329 RepID=UPI0037CC55FF